MNTMPPHLNGKIDCFLALADLTLPGLLTIDWCAVTVPCTQQSFVQLFVQSLLIS